MIGLGIGVLSFPFAGETSGLETEEVLVCLRLGDAAVTCLDLKKKGHPCYRGNPSLEEQ